MKTIKAVGIIICKKCSRNSMTKKARFDPEKSPKSRMEVLASKNILEGPDCTNEALANKNSTEALAKN